MSNEVKVFFGDTLTAIEKQINAFLKEDEKNSSLTPWRIVASGNGSGYRYVWLQRVP